MGESGQGAGRRARREVAPQELGLNPARLLPIVMETASTGKGGRQTGANSPANGMGMGIPRLPLLTVCLCTLNTNLSRLPHTLWALPQATINVGGWVENLNFIFPKIWKKTIYY